MVIERVKGLIRDGKVLGEVVEHRESGLTSKAAANALGIDLSHVIKTLLFVGKNTAAVVICLGSDKVDVKKLAATAGFKSHLAGRDELKRILGTEPGGTPPIGLPEDVLKVVDKRVMCKDFVVGSAGSEFAGLKIKPAEIIKQRNVIVEDVSDN